jgi:hypothetical protein
MPHDFLKSYGTEGPLGFPLTDKQARNLDALLKTLPKSKEFEYRKSIFAKAPTEVNPGERSDVSWISTETPDRYGHVVFAKGMNDSQFALNPIVTLNHNYSAPPIGRSLWRKFVKDGDTRGIKAKTLYPQMPDTWNQDGSTDPWMPDKVFAQIQAGLLNAKSIGWLPTKAHFADTKELMKNAWPEGALVIEEWLLIEYAVGTIPVNPETVVEVVSKTMTPAAATDAVIKHAPLAVLEDAIAQRIKSIDVSALVQDVLDQKRGRV